MDNLFPGKKSEIFVPLYCQTWHPKKSTILFKKIFRDFCPSTWAYLCQGLLSHYLDVYCQRWRRKNGQFGSRKKIRDFCPTILPNMAPEKKYNFVQENFKGFLSQYLGVFVPGTSVPLSGRILPKMAPKKWTIWFQDNFQTFLSYYTAKHGARKN